MKYLKTYEALKKKKSIKDFDLVNFLALRFSSLLCPFSIESSTGTLVSIYDSRTPAGYLFHIDNEKFDIIELEKRINNEIKELEEENALRWIIDVYRTFREFMLPIIQEYKNEEKDPEVIFEAKSKGIFDKKLFNELVEFLSGSNIQLKIDYEGDEESTPEYIEIIDTNLPEKTYTGRGLITNCLVDFYANEFNIDNLEDEIKRCCEDNYNDGSYKQMVDLLELFIQRYKNPETDPEIVFEKTNDIHIETYKIFEAKKKKFIPEDPKVIKKRWEYKRESIYNLKKNLSKLRAQVSKDLHSGDEREKLTALIVRIMLNTSERIGNDESASNGHFGITGFKNKHISVSGSKVTLDYKGKSGVDHEKSFSDATVAKILKGLKARNNKFIFTTKDGFRITAEKVNRYLSQFDAKSKDIRGFNSNHLMVRELKRIGKVSDEKERPKVFNAALKKIGEQIGHLPTTLRKHYLLPEIEENFYKRGTAGRVNID